MDAFRQKYVEEARDFLVELEKGLLELERKPDNRGVVEQIFRIMHTLKGNSAMFGFDLIDELTHQLETIYDLIRSEQLKVSKSILDLTLHAVDHVGKLLEDPDGADSILMGRHQEILKAIRAVTGEGQPDEAKISSQGSGPASPRAGNATWYIHFHPGSGVLKNGTNPLYLVEDFQELGSFLVIPDLKGIPALEEMDPELSYCGWEIILSTDQDEDAINELFIFVEDDCSIDVQELAPIDLLSQEGFTDKARNILNDGKGEHLQALRKEVEKCFSTPKEEAASDKATQTKASVSSGTQKKNTISSIRVSSEKLDELMNLVSELVTNQASLTLVSEKSQLPEIISIAENMEKITRQLRESTFDICLIPLDTITTRFHRLVRDLSGELDKEVEFFTDGTDTELDKNMIEGLADPLMHIIRNSMDHGIESREIRESMGKAPMGKIRLSSFYSGMNVYIRVNDDGAGIDPEKLRRKAIERNLITEDTQLSRKEIYDLILLPGFSTAGKVTDVSGRGVGMDVVKRKIEDLRGSVEIESELGKGSTITIKLPLTLSIIDGLLVTLDKTYFVIQLAVVDKIYDVATSMLGVSHNRLIPLSGDMIPYVDLREDLNMEGEPPPTTKVIVVRYNDLQVGLCVDEIVGEYQAVLKPLTRLFRKQELISGATILGDGTVALVLDTNKIIDQVSARESVIAYTE